MLTVNDYRLVLTGYLDSDFDNPIQNQFWYKAVGGTGSAPGLATTFNANIVPAVASLVTSRLVFTTIEVVNLVDLQDFTILSTGVPGDRGIILSNRWDCWAFQYLRPIRGMNNGSKRFGPISATDYSNEEADAGFLVDLDLASDAFETPLASLGGVSYAPCCVKTEKVPNENGNGKFHYDPIDLFICNSVAYQRVSHQDSRGAG